MVYTSFRVGNTQPQRSQDMITMNPITKETKKYSQPNRPVRNQKNALVHYGLNWSDLSRDPAPGDVPAIAFLNHL